MEPVRKQETDGRQVLSIGQINSIVRDVLASELHLQNIWIEGEISNLVTHTSGHIYFSLKDESSSLACTFFKGANQRNRDVKIANGLRIQARGGISVFVPRGQYQFNVQQVLPAGEGLLRLKIEQLKRKLYNEGLFAGERKRPLPSFPFTVGIVTAPTGAAIQDIIRVARSRFPNVNLLLAPCVVQGPEAPESIAYAIELLNRAELEVDVIIAGRGGGSFEDLLPFNEEMVVRAFASSRVPIVSAVGHEIDHPLTDLAADDFAATPSAAAQKVVPIVGDIMDRVEECALRLRFSLVQNHKRGKDRLQRVLTSRVHKKPSAMLEPAFMELDALERGIGNAMRARIQKHQRQLETFQNLPMFYSRRIQEFWEHFKIVEERLTNFSPLGTLKRGYSILRNGQNKILRRASETRINEDLEVILSQGKLRVKVQEVVPESDPAN
ncbi:MAG: exodeoxyribonuclease VII large subunit [Leptospirales bacterium]|nr:exodeoxyribonuclease VII large subunit [Leptospirales bacterium]